MSRNTGWWKSKVVINDVLLTCNIRPVALFESSAQNIFELMVDYDWVPFFTNKFPNILLVVKMVLSSTHLIWSLRYPKSELRLRSKRFDILHKKLVKNQIFARTGSNLKKILESL